VKVHLTSEVTLHVTTEQLQNSVFWKLDFFRYIIVNILREGDNKYNNNNNRKKRCMLINVQYQRTGMSRIRKQKRR